MADSAIRTIVESIHSSPTQAVVYLSGGASQVSLSTSLYLPDSCNFAWNDPKLLIQSLGWLMSVPGASNTLLEAVVPYSMISMVQLLGRVCSQNLNLMIKSFLFPDYNQILSFSQVPNQHCSQAMAKEMALLAYNRALKLSKPG